jgi:hypothetical protein
LLLTQLIDTVDDIVDWQWHCWYCLLPLLVATVNWHSWLTPDGTVDWHCWWSYGIVDWHWQHFWVTRWLSTAMSMNLLTCGQ